MDDPSELLARMPHSREEYVQRLLTMLILDAPYPRWNTPFPPSERGLDFLARLERRSYGEAGAWTDPVFIDEFDPPKRHDAEKGGAPDWALRDASRLWLIEWKTETSSHRADQLPAYYELGAHHHPELRLDLTYLTGPLTKPGPVLPPGARYAHLTWDEVLPDIVELWSSERPDAVAMLEEVLDALDARWAAWREGRTTSSTVDAAPSPEDLVVANAREVAIDHRQRGVETASSGLDDLQELRLRMRGVLASRPKLAGVRPWVWQQASSGGSPLTAAGAETGYELRLSWYGGPTAV